MPFGLKRSVLSRDTTPSAATIPHFLKEANAWHRGIRAVVAETQTEPKCLPRGDYPPSTLTNACRTIALEMSTKNAPTSGTTRNERGEAPYFLVVAVMMAMAVGVAPRASPK